MATKVGPSEATVKPEPVGQVETPAATTPQSSQPGNELKPDDQAQKTAAPTQASPAPDASPWLTEARKAAVVWIFALLLTPASVWLTLYITDVYKMPKPEIEYVNFRPLYAEQGPERTFAVSLNQDAFILENLPEGVRSAEAAAGLQTECTAWLDDEAWDADCLPIYRTATKELSARLNHEIWEMQRASRLGQTRIASFPPPPGPDVITGAIESEKRLGLFGRELERVRQLPWPRTGEFDLQIGVLNDGGSDGVVTNQAQLEVEGQGSYKLKSDLYHAVKSHTFEELTFRYSPSASDELSSAVRHNKAVSGKITITMSGMSKEKEVQLASDRATR